MKVGIRPIAEYTIRFAEGTFAYDITVCGAPDDVTERQAEEIVSRLYTRIHGAPLPAA